MTPTKYETDIAAEERELVARARRDGDVDAFFSREPYRSTILWEGGEDVG
jgi:hypothetical protein